MAPLYPARLALRLKPNLCTLSLALLSRPYTSFPLCLLPFRRKRKERCYRAKALLLLLLPVSLSRRRGIQPRVRTSFRPFIHLMVFTRVQRARGRKRGCGTSSALPRDNVLNNCPLPARCRLSRGHQVTFAPRRDDLLFAPAFELFCGTRGECQLVFTKIVVIQRKCAALPRARLLFSA